MPPKRYFYSKDKSFLEERLKNLDAYIKSLIEIHEIIENPILQKFLEIDMNYDPAFEYRPIDAVEYHNDPQFHVPLPKKRLIKPLIPLLQIPEKKIYSKTNSDPNLQKENSDCLNEAFEIEKKELIEYKEKVEEKLSEDQIEVGIQLAHKLCGLYTNELMEYYDLLHQSAAITNELDNKIKDADKLLEKCK